MNTPRITGRLEPETPRRVGSQQVTLQHTIGNEIVSRGGDTFAVVSSTAHGTLEQRLFIELYKIRKNLLADLVQQKRRLAVECTAADRPDKMGYQARGDRCFKKHGDLAGVDFPGIEPSDRSPGSLQTHDIRFVQLCSLS